MSPTLKNLIFSGLLLTLLFLALISGMRILETVLLPPKQEEAAAPKLTLTRDGKEYFPRQDITTVLVLGIDRTGPVQDSGSYQNPGAADLALILTFNHENATPRGSAMCCS